MLKLNDKFVKGFVNQTEVDNYQPFVDLCDRMLRDRVGPGSEFLGWLDLPVSYDRDEFAKILKVSEKIRSSVDVLLVVGIGGSYLGSKAVIEFINGELSNLSGCNGPEILFAGHNISSNYLNQLESYLEGKSFAINVISKSGTTTEPAIAFRHFKDILVGRLGDAANDLIFATTDKSVGALKVQADALGWETFVVPDDVGGRFSVLSAVGLLPIAVAGIDISSLMQGAANAVSDFKDPMIECNAAYKYAVLRQILLSKGKSIELLVGYEPNLMFFNEWYKQLFGESEGKDNKGIYPSSVIFSTDLHSMGQYIQEGRRDLFETVISFKEVLSDVTIGELSGDLDGLNFLAGSKVSDVNKRAFEATALAHVSGGVPNIVLEVDDMSAQSLGYMIYFFELSCAMSGYLLGVNPFDQPGVEEYKKNMFALLGKPGFEDLRKSLELLI